MRGRGVSIITCTKKPVFIENIFKNYANQKWEEKELIIVLNRDDMNLQKYQSMAKRYKNVKVFKLPQKMSLGACLNYAINRASYPYIAKFDDDDFYGVHYIEEAMSAMQKTKADIVGKRAIYMYIEFKNVLLLRFPRAEHKFVSLIAGGTIFAKKRICQQIRFANVTLGEDVTFLQHARAKGYKIYATSKNNFIGIRRKNPKLHTWMPKTEYLIKTAKVIGTGKMYRKLMKDFSNKRS